MIGNVILTSWKAKKSQNEGSMIEDDEGWMKNDEGWMKIDEGWWFQAVEGFCRQTDERTDEHWWLLFPPHLLIITSVLRDTFNKKMSILMENVPTGNESSSKWNSFVFENARNYFLFS